MNNPFIIGEVGINASGDINIAKQLIKMASERGCDAVKFQKRNIDLVYTREFLDSSRESPWGTTQREQKWGLEFGNREYKEINKYCKKLGIPWFASAWDVESQRFLHKFHLQYNKIASVMITNLELLEMVAEEGKHTFISTGIGTPMEIVDAVCIFEKHNCPFTLMHCVAKDPCPANECNLKRIPLLKKIYNCPVGYSSHYPGILDKSVAVTLGAEALEVHITLDRASYGTDQPSSLEGGGLTRVVNDARIIEEMIG